MLYLRLAQVSTGQQGPTVSQRDETSEVSEDFGRLRVSPALGGGENRFSTLPLLPRAQLLHPDVQRRQFRADHGKGVRLGQAGGHLLDVGEELLQVLGLQLQDRNQLFDHRGELLDRST